MPRLNSPLTHPDIWCSTFARIINCPMSVVFLASSWVTLFTLNNNEVIYQLLVNLKQRPVTRLSCTLIIIIIIIIIQVWVVAITIYLMYLNNIFFLPQNCFLNQLCYLHAEFPCILENLENNKFIFHVLNIVLISHVS